MYSHDLSFFESKCCTLKCVARFSFYMKTKYDIQPAFTTVIIVLEYLKMFQSRSNQFPFSTAAT